MSLHEWDVPLPGMPEPPLPPEVTTERARAHRQRATTHLGLHQSQADILTLTAAGHADPQIAAHLWLSINTVKTHHQRLRAKLGARDRVHAVILAAAAGAIALPHDQLEVLDVCDLSLREVQVIALVAAGWTNAVAGARLGLSPLTVKSHLARIATRVGCGNRALLALATWHAGLIDPPPRL